MIGKKRRWLPKPFDPRQYSAEGLLVWCRRCMPDLRIGFALVDGERRAFARWSLGRDVYERTAANEDELAQLVATAIARLLRIPVQADRGEAQELERQVLEAALAGQPETADALARQLALRNEGLLSTPTVALRN